MPAITVSSRLSGHSDHSCGSQVSERPGSVDHFSALEPCVVPSGKLILREEAFRSVLALGL